MTVTAPTTAPDLRDIYGQYIAGEWTDRGARRRPVVNPATEQTISELTDADQSDVDAAVKSAGEAWRSWSASGAAARSRGLHALADALEQRGEHFASLDSVDAGIPMAGMRRDVANAVAYIRYFANLTTELKGHTVESAVGSYSFTVREPFGVVGRIVPFNHPLQFAAAAIAAPLAAGNAVVLKPSEHTSVSALHFAELVSDTLGPGLVNVVCGPGQVGAWLVEHPAVQRIGFTGSLGAARSVLTSSAHAIKRVSLELGGKNPLIVLADASPDRAAQLALIGMNLERTAGQSCGSTSRIYVHDKIHDAFAASFTQLLGTLRPGDPLDPATTLGPLAFADHYDRVIGYIEAATAEQAQLLCGGRRPPEVERGFFIEPTLFDNVEDGMTIAREEIFGPVAALLRFSDEDDMISRANDTDLGLTANIVTNDLSAAARISRLIDAGFVWINGRGQRPFGAPFGGHKQSGLGEENSLGELLSYTQLKNVTFSPAEG